MVGCISLYVGVHVDLCIIGYNTIGYNTISYARDDRMRNLISASHCSAILQLINHDLPVVSGGGNQSAW